MVSGNVLRLSLFLAALSSSLFAQNSPGRTDPVQAAATESAAMAERPRTANGSTTETRGRRRGSRDINNSETTSSGRAQRRNRGPQAPPGQVLPTSSGRLGGATSYTQTLPLHVEKLIDLRRPFTNRPEFRGAWVTRFEWVGQRGARFDAAECRKRIVDFMTSASRINLNAVVWQVRGDATTLYPSKLEPWSQLIGGKDPGFDPVELAIKEAHKRGLEFHAYINPVPCSEERTTEPASKDHIWYKHCLPESEPNWLVYTDGKPAPFSEYKWLNPNLPEVQLHVRNVVMDFIKRYDTDGVHFDRIRLPNDNVSDDPWSKARFEGGANPNNKSYNDWQAENITRMLTDLYACMMEEKPHIKVSAAVWGIYDNTRLPQGSDRAVGYSWTSSGLQNYMQDSISWINGGCMDALIPMIYWSMGADKPDYDELLMNFMTMIHNGRHLYGGQSVFSPEEMLREVVATNIIGGHGTVPFTLTRISREETGEFYRKNIYPRKAPVPEMPWKTNPVYGHVIAVVTGADGKPVRDAHVKVEGRDYIGLSAEDGLCGVLNILPGNTEVTAELSDGTRATATVEVVRGKVSRVQLQLK